MNDLGRFFRQIVRNLAATDPARLQGPLKLSEIRRTILPYRANRRALQLETSEDYELVLMRLCAGEGGYVRTEPADVRAEFETEVGSSNPDLEILDRHEDAVLSLEATSVARALNPNPDLTFAPPDHASRLEETAAPPPVIPAQRPLDPSANPRCTNCGASLPAGRLVNFCPHCGRSQALTHCPVCQGEVEAGWRHCVSCGYQIRDG